MPKVITELIGLIFILFIYTSIIILIVKAVKQKKKKTNINTNNTNYQHNLEYKPQGIENETTIKDEEEDWSQCYQKSYLLTKNEYQEYKKLKQYADKHNLQICPKVRLLDIITPRNGPKQRAALGKISSKHIDFLICDKNLYIKGIIELDDNSHNQKERKERDEFVDHILTSVGYKIIHVHTITETTLNSFIETTGKEEGI